MVLTSFGVWRQIVLVADETCAPELEPRRFELIAFNDAVFVPGWFKQQVRACDGADRRPTIKACKAHMSLIPENTLKALDPVMPSQNPVWSGPAEQNDGCRLPV